MQDPKNLAVWKKCHQLTVDVHRVTDAPEFPRRWPLIDQIQKSVLPVESNVTGGQPATTTPNSSILVAKDLGYLATEDHERHSKLLEEIRKMLWGLIQRLMSSLGRR